MRIVARIGRRGPPSEPRELGVSLNHELPAGREVSFVSQADTPPYLVSAAMPRGVVAARLKRNDWEESHA